MKNKATRYIPALSEKIEITDRVNGGRGIDIKVFRQDKVFRIIANKIRYDKKTQNLYIYSTQSSLPIILEVEKNNIINYSQYDLK